MKRTKEAAEKTRSKILTTAIKIFNKNGFNATKLEEIAEKAGVTRGAIYHHFKNKHELFAAICRENKSAVMDLVESVYERGLSPLETLKEALNLIVKKLESDKGFRNVEELLFKTQLTGVDIVEKLHQENDNHGLQQVKKVLNLAENKNELNPNISIDTATKTIATFYYGLLAIWLINPKEIDFISSRENIIDVLFEGLYNKQK